MTLLWKSFPCFNSLLLCVDLPTIPCIEREELIDTVFQLSAYNYPEGIQLPRE